MEIYLKLLWSWYIGLSCGYIFIHFHILLSRREKYDRFQLNNFIKYLRFGQANMRRIPKMTPKQIIFFNLKKMVLPAQPIFVFLVKTTHGLLLVSISAAH